MTPTQWLLLPTVLFIVAGVIFCIATDLNIAKYQFKRRKGFTLLLIAGAAASFIMACLNVMRIYGPF